MQMLHFVQHDSRFKIILLKRFLIISYFLFVSFALKAQFQNREFVLPADSFQLDSGILFKNSIQVSSAGNSYSEGIDFRINYFYSAFINLKIPKNTFITFRYKTLSYDFRKSYQNKNMRIIDPEYNQTQNPFLYNSNEENNFGTLNKNDGLKLNGSISRGLGFGNNQNLVLNSNLNLQMSGKLNNEIDVVAAISDDNNPIQPEGNTQQLQDFDKVFIQLSKNNNKLTVGDFEMKRPDESYFLNYYKKSRGGQFQTEIPLKKNKLTIGANAAISRGRFARNTINGIEGNQGPYRLTGDYGELFIIVISGTEAIYLDGQKLTRGEQNDYIIDYNSGEVVFTPKKIITQYSRIIIEFQYSDRNYARTVFTLSSAYQSNYYTVRANYFSEQDDKDQAFQQTLSADDKQTLSSSGNKLNTAVIAGEKRVKEFSESKILYRKIDTLNASGVFVYTNTAGNDTVFYEVKFSFVGNNKGRYIQSANAVNGRVFRYAGVGNGNFEPVILLIAPNRRQMLNAGFDYLGLRNTKISLELARSDFDKNTFSNLDKENNAGYGMKIDLANDQFFKGKKIKLQNSLNYENVDKNFRYVERYRNVEFDRIWNRQLINYSNNDTGYNEQIISAKSDLQIEKKANLFYQLSHYNRNNIFLGWQNSGGISFNTSIVFLKINGELLSISDKNPIANSSINNAVKYSIENGFHLNKNILAIKTESEESRFVKSNDTLLSGSFKYNQHSIYLTNQDSAFFKYKIEANLRDDYSPTAKNFDQATRGLNLIGSSQLIQKNFNRLNVNFTYREFNLLANAIPNLKPEKTIVARIEYDYTFLKRMVSANTYYQISSGNELIRDFSFIEVPNGQGIYVWKDFNEDGIQQLNEFVLSGLADKNTANFIKVYLPTSSLIRTNGIQFNQTIQINPSVLFNNKTGLRKFISKWSEQAAFRIDRKSKNENNFNFLNPVFTPISDTSLISANIQARNTIFFNRSHPIFGFDINWLDNQNKNLLTNGTDSRRKTEQSINLRWNMNSTVSLNASYNYGNKNYMSEYFTAQNYNFFYSEWKPKLIYQANPNLRITLNLSYTEAANSKTFGEQKGTINETGFELRYNFTQVAAITAKYSFYEVKFIGDVSSNLGYEMLQGFIVGDNQLWNLNIQQRIGQNLQINVAYDGRKSIDSDIIHSGRMEARYIF